MPYYHHFDGLLKTLSVVQLKKAIKGCDIILFIAFKCADMYMQARSQKLLLGVLLDKMWTFLAKQWTFFYKTVDLLNEIEDIFSKIMAF